MQERQEVFGYINDLRQTQALPAVEGFTCDTVGTNKGEQGMSYHLRDGQPVVGYHIIDPSHIPEGGNLETYAFGRQSDKAWSSNAERLFGDRVFHHRLNLIGDQSQPVVSYYFQSDSQGNFKVSHSEISLFRAQHNFKYTEEGSLVEPSDFLLNFINTFQAPNSCQKSIPRIEAGLRDQAKIFTVQQLGRIGYAPFADEQGVTSFNHPMQNWADFKNLSFYSKLLRGEVPLYSDAQLAVMQQRASGGKNYEPGVLVPDQTAHTLVKLLQTPNVTKRTLDDQTLRQLIERFDPDEARQDLLLVRVLAWASLNQLVKIDPVDDTKLTYQFKNLDKDLVIKPVDPLNDPLTAYQAMVEYLQRLPRQPVSPGIKSRSMLRDLQRNAALQSVSESDRRELSALMSLFKGGRRRLAG
jgi:hypothetical protein